MIKFVKAVLKHYINQFYLLPFRFRKNVVIGSNVQARDFTLLTIDKDAELSIQDDVILNSRNNGYHIQMFRPNKIMVDRPGARVTINSKSIIHGSCIHAYKEIIIGRNVLIAANCQIFDCSGHELSMDNPEERLKPSDRAKPIYIGDNVWIGTGCIILGGVTIGDDSIVAAGSVVTKSVPSRCIAGGNPAQIIRQY
jgi:acetyltransferase-like isoleucine patch superfamily enzyme